MKPAVGFFPFIKWITRLFLPFLFYYVYKNELFTWQFQQVHYLMIFGLSLFSVLLLIGGFFRKSNLTIVSSWLLIIFGVIFIIIDWKVQIDVIMSSLSIIWGLLFMSIGNRVSNLQKSR